MMLAVDTGRVQRVARLRQGAPPVAVSQPSRTPAGVSALTRTGGGAL